MNSRHPALERHLVESNRALPLDDLGFLSVWDWGGEQASHVQRSDVLTTPGAWFVTAAPMMGKTWLLRELYRYLNATTETEFLHRAELGRADHRTNLLPGWWSEWSKTAARAYWLVDALDEGELFEPRICERVLELIEALSPEARGRLTVVASCRSSEVPIAFKSLTESRFRAFQLAPLTRDGAAEMLGGAEKLHELEPILRTRGLRQVAAIPSVLQAIAASPESFREGGKSQVWRTVAAHLLSRPDEESPVWRPIRRSPEGRMLEAAEAIAFFATFGETELFSTSLKRGAVSLEAVLEGDAYEAGRDALSSALFAHDTAGLRFAQKHLREWLCAHALGRLVERGESNRLKAILAPGGKLSGAHAATARALLLVKPAQIPWLDALVGTEDGRFVSALLDAADAPLQRLWRVRLDELRDVSLERSVAESMRRPDLTAAQSHVLLELADQNPSEELIGLSLRWALDPSRPIDVRLEALRLCAAVLRGSALSSLRRVLDEDLPPDGARIKAVAIFALLREGIVSYREALLAHPRARQHVLDDVRMLAKRLEEIPSVDDALFILEDLPRRDATWLNSEFGRELRVKALKFLARTEVLGDQIPTIAALLKECFASDRYDEYAPSEALRVRSTELRRAFFVLAVENHADQQDRWTHHALRLQGEDFEWLRARAGGGTPNSIELRELMILARRKGPLDVEEVRSLILSVVPEVLAKFDADVASAERHEREWRASQEARHAEVRAKTPIAEVVDSILSRTEREPGERLRQLGWVCFSDFRPADVDGEFEGLDEQRRLRVFDALSALVPSVEPTPIDRLSRSIPAWALYEAAALEALFAHEPLGPWLLPTFAVRWIPTLLKVETGSELTPLLGRFFQLAPDDFDRELLNFVDAELARGDTHVVYARRARDESWDGSFGEAIGSRIGDDARNAEGRASLLRLLAEKNGALATDVARGILKSSALSPLFGSAAAALTLLHPDEGLEWLEQNPSRENLLELAPYSDHWAGPQLKVGEWPTKLQTRLLALLARQFGGETERPEFEAHWVTDTDRLTSLRRQLLTLVLQDVHSRETRVVLEEIRPFIPSLSENLADIDAHGRVAAFLTARRSVAEERIPVPFPNLVELWRRTESRWTPTPRDLVEAVADSLSRMARDGEWDRPLLYEEKERGVMKRRHEDVLQAYLHRRLRDWMPGRVVTRESLAPYDNRSDLEILEVHLTSGKRVHARVEVKWSDNRQVLTALHDQLWERYMRPTGIQGGVYVVAWCGKGPAGCISKEQLKARLEAEEHEFNKQHDGDSYVKLAFLDLEWAPPSRDRSARRRRTPSRFS